MKRNKENIRTEFVKSLINDKERNWKYITLHNEMNSDYMISSDGILVSLRQCKYMKPCLNTSGYRETVIRHKSSKINVSIHRLVAEAFLPNPENKPQVNHKDGNKENNSFSNLEWVTLKENISHAIENGLRSNYVKRKDYTDQQIHEVCKLLEQGKSIRKTSSNTSVSKRVIRSIISGKSYKNISKYYNIPKDQTSTTIQSTHVIEEEIIFGFEKV